MRIRDPMTERRRALQPRAPDRHGLQPADLLHVRYHLRADREGAQRPVAPHDRRFKPLSAAPPQFIINVRENGDAGGRRPHIRRRGLVNCSPVP